MLPAKIQKLLPTLCDGDFVDRGDNVLAFGLPGRGKTHLVCAIGHELVRRGRRVWFTPTFSLVQKLLAAKRDLRLEKDLAALDVFDAVILDDIGYVQQDRDEMEVLFTFLAQRHERRSVIIASNLLFRDWDRIFKDPMTTAAAIDRLVHHAVIVEMTGPSIREAEGKKRGGLSATTTATTPTTTTTKAHSTTEIADAADEDHERAPDKNEVAVDHQGFNLHAGVRIDAGDDLGRERLARYALRPPLSLERLRRLPGGIAYRLKYVSRGRGKHRVMTPMEFMARLSAIVAPPRYPLVRDGGVLAPRSEWRRDVVPRPRDHGRRAPSRPGATTRQPPVPLAPVGPRTTARVCGAPHRARPTSCPSALPFPPRLPLRPGRPRLPSAAPVHGSARTRPGDVLMLTPNVLSVRH